MLLAHPRGPVDPTASVKRGVFAPADTWVSTEYLFRRDEDGDYWLVDNRAGDPHRPGPVYAARSTTRVGRIGAVDLAVTYGVEAGGQQLAVTALALRPGGSIPRPICPRRWPTCRRVAARHRARGAGDDAGATYVRSRPTAGRRHPEGGA